MFEAEANAHRAEHRKLAWHTWHVAALQRQEKMPRLDKFISPVGTKPKTRQTALQQMKIMEAWASRVNRKDKS